MRTKADAPALVRELRQAARKREALADAYARRAKQYRAEAAEMRTAAVQVARRLKRSEIHRFGAEHPNSLTRQPAAPRRQSAE
ncbi:MAG: hypothetical protein K6W08_02125 [Firmicutes bacterium]|nr:hypothetical protein [Bacillota bacterium]